MPAKNVVNHGWDNDITIPDTGQRSAQTQHCHGQLSDWLHAIPESILLNRDGAQLVSAPILLNAYKFSKVFLWDVGTLFVIIGN